MNYFVLGLLLAWTVLTPGSAKSTETNVYRVVAFRGDIKKNIQKTEHLKMCGKYFAAGVTNIGPVLLFTLEKKSGRKVVLGPREVIVVSIDENAESPRATMGKKPVILRMKNRDYQDGLPCLADPAGRDI
jgi:hypothetical protein